VLELLAPPFAGNARPAQEGLEFQASPQSSSIPQNRPWQLPIVAFASTYRASTIDFSCAFRDSLRKRRSEERSKQAERVADRRCTAGLILLATNRALA
jgi:hypothetical protein